MEAELLPVQSPPEDTNEDIREDKITPVKRESTRATCEDESNDPNDDTIHGFNISNVTVITKEQSDKSKLNLNLDTDAGNKMAVGDGSDSGVEGCGTSDVIVQRAFSTDYASSCGNEDHTPLQSCDSSLISCCSTYEDAYEILARKNSTLLEDLKLGRGDGTSEGGSESSSITGSCSSRPTKRFNPISAKSKKVTVNETISRSGKQSLPAPVVNNRSRGRAITPRVTPPIGQDKTKTNCLKSVAPRTPNIRSNSLTPKGQKIQDKKKDTPVPSKNRTPRASSASRVKTPILTPSDDGRWPLIHRNTPMTRSYRGGTINCELSTSKTKLTHLSAENKNSIDKYATLPRRRKERSAESIKDSQKQCSSREPSVNRAASLRKQASRESTPNRNLPPYPRKKVVSKTKIYHEICSQTALTSADIENALAGIGIKNVDICGVEKIHTGVQVDRRHEKVEQLEAQIKTLTEKYNKVLQESKDQKEKVSDIEQKLAVEKIEKQALKEELERNMKRVQTILGSTEDNINQEGDNDSLLVLESRFQAAGKVIIKQENEISELYAFCRNLQRDLEKGMLVQKTLTQQQQDLENESVELQEFLQAEKTTLSEALHEAESKIKNYQQTINQKDNDIESKQDECKHLVRISEQRRQENLSLQAKLGALESRSRDLLLQQGAAVSSAAVALSGLTSRIDGFVEQLVVSYNISDKDLEDVIFHNEAYSNSNSSDDGSPDRSCTDKRSPSPKKGSSFVTALISAIKNAAAQTPFANVSRMTDDHSDSTEMLDSETEPCLMMENVLEDVPVPDGHTHNMISSSHSLLKCGMLARSESLQNLSQAILNRQLSEQARLDGSLCDSLTGSYSENMVSLSDICPAVTLVDQVIEADNLLTKLLKVLRIIQMENDTCISQVQDEKSELSEKLQKQRDVNEKAAQQLKDWEALGAKLKSELKEVKCNLTVKNRELDDVKADIQNHRQQIERLNQDVCDLSTTCSKAELQLRVQEEQATELLKEWQETGQLPNLEVMSKTLAAINEMPMLKEKLIEKEKQLDEITREFQASRQVMSENWNQAVIESRKQYEAIDTALETLHSIQSVVQQCPPLSKLQRDLEETSFHCASNLPFVPMEYNTNATILQTMASVLTVTQATA